MHIQYHCTHCTHHDHHTNHSHSSYACSSNHNGPAGTDTVRARTYQLARMYGTFKDVYSSRNPSTMKHTLMKVQTIAMTKPVVAFTHRFPFSKYTTTQFPNVYDV